MHGMDSMGMDMSGMDHSMMEMAPSPSPMMMGPSPGGQMSMSMSHSESGGDGMLMMMMMWFQATTKATLWFREWNTDTRGKYAASIIGLVFLCLCQEGLVWLRLYIARRASGRMVSSSDMEAVSGLGHPDSTMITTSRFEHPLIIRFVISFLYALNLASSYLLMLAIMTYNIGYFIAIVVSLAVGHLIFMRVGKSYRPELSDACCPAHCCTGNQALPPPKMVTTV